MNPYSLNSVIVNDCLNLKKGGKNLGEIKLNTIYNEDCLVTMQRMPDEFVDLIVTSPPY